MKEAFTYLNFRKFLTDSDLPMIAQHRIRYHEKSNSVAATYAKALSYKQINQIIKGITDLQEKLESAKAFYLKLLTVKPSTDEE